MSSLALANTFFLHMFKDRRKDVKHNLKCSSFKIEYLTALNPISFSDFTSLSISLWKGVVAVKIENKKHLTRGMVEVKQKIRKISH